MSIDYQVLMWLNSLAGHSAVLDLAIVLFAKYLIYLLVIVPLLFWFAKQDRLRVRYRLVAAFLSALLARFVVVEIIHLLLPRNRPFISYNLHQLITKDNESSFPSGHTTFAVALGMSLYFYNKKIGLIILVLACLMGVARVMAGIHYPSDVAGGVIVGIITAFLIEKLLAKRTDRFTTWASGLSDKILPFTKL